MFGASKKPKIFEFTIIPSSSQTNKTILIAVLSLFTACHKATEGPSLTALRSGLPERLYSVADRLEKDGTPLIIVTYPWMAQIHPNYSTASAYAERAVSWSSASEELQKVSRGLPLECLTPSFIKEFRSRPPEHFYKDSLHWGIEGNLWIAGQISKKLEEEDVSLDSGSILLLGDSFAQGLKPELEAETGSQVMLRWQNGAADRIAVEVLSEDSSLDDISCVVWLLADQYLSRRGYFSWNDERVFPEMVERPVTDELNFVQPSREKLRLIEVPVLPDRHEAPYADALISARAQLIEDGQEITLIYRAMENRRFDPVIAFFREGLRFDGFIEPFTQVELRDGELEGMFRIGGGAGLSANSFWLHGYSNLSHGESHSRAEQAKAKIE